MKRKYEIVVLSKGGYARTLRIYAPKHADRAVIMHDGQNVFYDEDAAYKKSWRALDMLKAAKIKNVAIIGIDNMPTRDDDYFPFHVDAEKFGMAPFGGKTDEYCEFITDIVLPYLDKRFGYKFYGALGSSFGATATLYLATKRDPRFRAYGMFSTPLFVYSDAFDKLFESKPFDKAAMYRVYVGGNEEADLGEYSPLVPELYVDDAHKLIKALRFSGATDIRMRLEGQNVHDEISWREPEREFFADFAKL